MNENLYIAHEKTSTQNLACLQRMLCVCVCVCVCVCARARVKESERDLLLLLCIYLFVCLLFRFDFSSHSACLAGLVSDRAAVRCLHLAVPCR